MKLEKVLLKINQWGAGAILVAPILVSSSFIFPFVQLKNIYFRSLVLILLVTLVWYIIESGKLAGKRNYTLGAMIVLGLVTTAASVFGLNFFNSVWGNFERMDGLFNLWLLIIYFILLINVFRKTNEWLWLLRISLLTSLLTAIIGLFKNGWLMSDNEWSNLGNSAFLGLYMLLNLVLGLVALLSDKAKSWRYFYILALAVDVLVLLGTASRAPVVGLVFGALVTAILLWKGSTKKYKLTVGGIAVILVILGGLVWTYRDSTAIGKVKFLSRLAHISRQDATTNSRLLVWQSSWQSFLERPILGYGPNNFIYGLNKYYDPRAEEQWFDRAHNFVFDYANTAGILGLLSYLGIFGAAFYQAFLIRKKEKTKGSIVIGCLVAYLTTLLFVFDTINTWLPALVLFAYISFAARENENDYTKFYMADWGYYPVLAIVIILAVLGGYNGVIKPVRTNLLMAEAYKYSAADYKKTMELYHQAMMVGGIGEREIVLQENRYVLDALNNDQFNLQAKKAIFEQAEKDSLALLKKDPRELQVRLALAQTYLAYAKLNTFYIEETVNLLQEHITDSPKRVEIYFMLAQAKVLGNDYLAAIDWLERAYQAANEMDSVYENLMTLYAYTKNQVKLDQVAQEYIDKFPLLTAEQYRKVGQSYFQVGELAKAESIVRDRAIPREPENWMSYVSLASIYEQKKEYKKAAEYLSEVLNEHPNWADDVRATVEAYIGDLESKK